MPRLRSAGASLCRPGGLIMPEATATARDFADGNDEAICLAIAAADLRPPIQSIALDAFLSLSIPAKSMLLAPWLPEKGLALVFAPRGVGKTHFALGVAYAVASAG